MEDLWDKEVEEINPEAAYFGDMDENQRWEREQEFEHERAYDVALQSYLDQMGRLLIEQDLYDTPLRPIHGPAILARAYTLTALERVDST